MVPLVNCTKHLKRINANPQTLQNIKEEGTLQNLFYEDSIPFIPKSDKDTTRKKISDQYPWWT